MPRYASPEQRAHARVTTASDVYSLGVLLAESLDMLECLGQALMRAHQYEEAEGVFQRMLAGRRRLSGPDSTDTAVATASLARMLDNSGRSLEALPLYQEALAIIARRQGADSPLYGVLLYNAAGAAEYSGDVDAAGPMYARALAVLEKLWDEKNLAPVRRNVGLFLLRTDPRASGTAGGVRPLLVADAPVLARLEKLARKPVSTFTSRGVIAGAPIQWLVSASP